MPVPDRRAVAIPKEALVPPKSLRYQCATVLLAQTGQPKGPPVHDNSHVWTAQYVHTASPSSILPFSHPAPLFPSFSSSSFVLSPHSNPNALCTPFTLRPSLPSQVGLRSFTLLAARRVVHSYAVSPSLAAPCPKSKTRRSTLSTRLSHSLNIASLCILRLNRSLVEDYGLAVNNYFPSITWSRHHG